MLSGLEILKQIKEGNIVISDFSEDRLNPNSYNIRLGNKLKIYESASVSKEELQQKINERTKKYREEYYNICSELQGEKLFSLEASEERSKKMEEINFNVMKITEEVVREHALDPRKDNKTIDIEIPDKGYVLLPGTLYLGETMEYTETYGFIPNIDGRSTTGRLGIEIHRTAGFGDNGFKGKWTLEITVTHPVIVYSGMEIGQLYYETIDGDSSMKYNGKYQNQQGVQAAKVDKTRE